MPLFSYRGRDTRGDLVRGTLDGSDSGAIADQLQASGIIPTEIQPSIGLRVSASQGSWLGKNLLTKKILSLNLIKPLSMPLPI